MTTWEEMDQTTSRVIAYSAFIAFFGMFMRLYCCSQMYFLKVVSFMFVLGSVF